MPTDSAPEYNTADATLWMIQAMKALVDASLANGIEYLFDWVLYDQPGNKDEHGRDASHFGKYGQDRMLTPQGREFHKWFPMARTASKAVN